jgi:hypothetical protein
MGIDGWTWPIVHIRPPAGERKSDSEASALHHAAAADRVQRGISLMLVAAGGVGRDGRAIPPGRPPGLRVRPALLPRDRCRSGSAAAP